MRRQTPILTAAMLLSTAGAAPLAAQASCTGGSSCTVTNTASVTVGSLISLAQSATTTTLAAPTAADLGTEKATTGPTLTVKANQAWTLDIHTSNLVTWSYSGSAVPAGVKPIGHLKWSNAELGTFAAITNVGATLTSGSATNSTEQVAYFKTVYDGDFSDASNRPGTYSIDVVFTLSAP